MALSRVSSDARLCTFSKWGRESRLSRGPNYLRIVLLVFTFTILLAATSRLDAQVTIYVNDDAPPGGDGMSWGSALDDLETSLGIALTGDQIWVASGTYRPSSEVVPGNSRSATFQLLNGVAMYGGFSGTETSPSERDLENPANETILSGDLAGDDGPNFANYGENTYHIVTGSGTDASAVLDGFAIRGGNADGAGDARNDGGLSNVGGGPSVRRGILYLSRALVGVHGDAGMYITAGRPIVEDCRFS